MTDFTVILRSLRSRLFSTATTVTTVALAVALLVVLLALRASSAKAFDRGTGTMHLLVSADSSPLVSVLNSVFYANAPQRALPIERYEKLKASLPLGDNGFAIPTVLGDSFKGQPVMGTTPEFFTRYAPAPGEKWELAQGEFFKSNFEVVVGSRAAQGLGLKVGSKIHIAHGYSRDSAGGEAADAHAHDDHAHDDHDHAHDDHDHAHDHDHDHGEAHVHREFTYTVVGVLRPTGTSHDRALFTDLESAWIIHAHDRRLIEDPKASTTTPADLIPADKKITGIYVALATRAGSAAPANLPQVFASLRADPTLTVASPADEARRLLGIVGNVDQILLAMAAAVLLVSGVGIMLALYDATRQRRRQIAVIRTLGASRARVFSLVLTESAIIGVLGAALGVLLAFAAGALVAQVMRQRTGLFITPELPATDAFLVAAGAVVLACAAGLVPAVIAYRTSVANHLKPIA